MDVFSSSGVTISNSVDGEQCNMGGCVMVVVQYGIVYLWIEYG